MNKLLFLSHIIILIIFIIFNIYNRKKLIITDYIIIQGIFLILSFNYYKYYTNIENENIYNTIFDELNTI